MIKKAFAKVNIFLKITGTRGEYHTILSRFMIARSLYDTLALIPKSEPSEEFKIDGTFGCPKEDNSIFKAYKILCEEGFKPQLDKLFKFYFLSVEKRIPEGSGLGGGSSDAASFLMICNEVANLNLSVDKMAQLALRIGADVPFFLYNYPFANVRGVGEEIEPFLEDSFELELKFLPIICDTKKVYSHYRKHRLNEVDISLANSMSKTTSKELLEKYDAQTLNDLLFSALTCYPKLEEYLEEGWYMSGSGSTLFRIKNG